jgi:Flp pilus assembly pilin Flp
MLDRLNTFALSLFARVQIVRSETGQAMVEYTLIVALLSVVAIFFIKTVGGDITEAWKTIETEF